MKLLKMRMGLSVTNRIEEKSFLENVVQAAAVCFMLVAVFSAHFSVFEMNISTAQMVITLFFSTLFLLLIMWNRKNQIKVRFAGAAVLAFVGVGLRNTLYGGVSSYINAFIERYNDYYSNSKASIVAESTEYSSLIALFFLGATLGFVLYIVLDKKKGIIFTILIAMLPVILAAVVGKLPLPANWWITIVAVCFYLLVYRQKQGIVSVNGFVMLAGILAGVIVLSIIIQTMIIDYKNLHIDEYKQVRSELLDTQEKNIGDWKDMASDLTNSKVTLGGGISKGKLSKNSSVNPTGEVAMEIVMTKRPSQTLYLKAYVGSKYTGKSWEEISNRELSEVLPGIGGAEKRRELMNESFRRVSEGDFVTSANPPREEELTIELINASREFGYVPYCAEITREHKVHKDLYVEGDLSKTRKYKFYPFSIYGGSDAHHLSEYFVYPSYGEANFLEYFGVELAEISELGAAYQEFVKTAYVDKHKELKNLRQFCDSINKENVEGELSYLFDNGFYYSKNPGEMPKDMDFVEGFMFSRHVGYCVHFATATTLVYQMCGYPARYVEGYAVSPSAFVRYEDGTYHATVTDESAHAWCEVYDTEIGWVAKDFTPGAGEFSDTIVQNEEELSEENITVESPNEEMIENEPQHLEESREDPQSNEDIVDNSEGNDVQGGFFPGKNDTSEGDNAEYQKWEALKAILFKVLVVIIVVILLAMIFLFQQKVRYAKRLKSFKQKKDNKGVLSIYSAICELCVVSGFQTEKERERDKMKEMAAQFPQISNEEWEQIYMWAEKAAFSNEKLPVEVQKKMYRSYRKLRNEILKMLSFKKKMWFLWIKAM